jgi:hypothetical protein
MASSCAIVLLLAACLGAEPIEPQASATLVAERVRAGTQVQCVADEHGATILEVECKPGIGEATIRRRTPAWPRHVSLRLHLRGLESLRVKSGDTAIEWMVSSHGDNATTVSLQTPKGTSEIDRDSPYFAAVRIVAKNQKIPLADGWFELDLPAKLLAKNPETIALFWIDVYRQ